MAKLIALPVAGQPNRMIWVHPDAVESLRATGTGNTIITLRSGGDIPYVAGEPDFIASKLNSASD